MTFKSVFGPEDDFDYVRCVFDIIIDHVIAATNKLTEQAIAKSVDLEYVLLVLLTKAFDGITLNLEELVSFVRDPR